MGVVDRLTKYAHFLPVMSTNSAIDYARIFIDEIFCIHVIPLSTISEWVAQFISRFWRPFQEGLGTLVKLSTALHPQTNG